MVATHDSSTLSGTGAVCLAHWCFWWQSMPWQRVMSLSTGTLQLVGDGEEAQPDLDHLLQRQGVVAVEELLFKCRRYHLIRSSPQGGGDHATTLNDFFIE